MQGKNDPVDNVMESLGSRPWPGDYDNQQLKEKIMQKCNTQRSGSGFRSRGALVATLAFVLLGAVGFTAAGGVELLKNWIITVEVDGSDVPITIDADDIQIETDDDGVTTVTIDSADIEGIEEVEEGATITITATGTDDGTMVIQNADGETTKKGAADDD